MATALRLRPDAVVLDLQMPEPDGIEVARRLVTELPGCRCIIVTSHGRPGYLKSALASGVRSFLPKTVSSPTLALVVRNIANDGRYVDPELAAEAMGVGDSPLTPARPTSLPWRARALQSTRSHNVFRSPAGP
ncbi:response regulator [Mycolicibacterium nivoides]|uniref:Response regulator n=1 Tax=Mycolicibacterium nivoides TaxID=2487344 RepID=A0ABW9LGV4_9MYCO